MRNDLQNIAEHLKCYLRDVSGPSISTRSAPAIVEDKLEGQLADLIAGILSVDGLLEAVVTALFSALLTTGYSEGLTAFPPHEPNSQYGDENSGVGYTSLLAEAGLVMVKRKYLQFKLGYVGLVLLLLLGRPGSASEGGLASAESLSLTAHRGLRQVGGDLNFNFNSICVTCTA